MTRALLISRFFPFNAEKVHGIYQRLGTQIEALARVADRIDCLFLVPVDQDCSAEAVREHQERLRRLWSPAIDLTLAPTLRYDAPQGRWQRVVEGIFDFQRQLIARPTCTAGAVEAVSAALDSRPDLVLVHRLDAMGVLMRLSRGTPQQQALQRDRPHQAAVDVGKDGVERDRAEELRDGGEAARDGALFEGLDEMAGIGGEDGDDGEDFRDAFGRGFPGPILCGSGWGSKARGGGCSGHRWSS